MNLIRKRLQIIAFTLLLSVITVIGANVISDSNNKVASTEVKAATTIPAYKGKSYVVQNSNKPQFTKSQLKNKKSYERYGKLDKYGRCTTCIANIGKDLMPTGKRGPIGMIKPTGWHTVKYDCVDGKYLYNRCHLIGYQLTGENANKRNLITGTRSLNVDGILPFENMVADYIKETGNHVLYRVTPVFKGKEKLARGVKMEAQSIEDNGKGIKFNVFVFNVQKGVTINYSDGSSRLSNKKTSNKTPAVNKNVKYVWIPKSGTKYHYKKSCGGMRNPSKVKISVAKKKGYTACKKCVK
ncbi:DNA/RNA non-specific endonuclease [Anaerostipes sp.]|uniref:DNA/RNA non-specific endonuclease n=1 Tax=Anaerostipes sp. TaxID=1872530 RepID=UPI002F414B42